MIVCTPRSHWWVVCRERESGRCKGAGGEVGGGDESRERRRGGQQRLESYTFRCYAALEDAQGTRAASLQAPPATPPYAASMLRRKEVRAKVITRCKALATLRWWCSGRSIIVASCFVCGWPDYSGGRAVSLNEIAIICFYASSKQRLYLMVETRAGSLTRLQKPPM